MATSIDDLPLDRDVTSREGVSLDYMARVRIAYLMGQNQTDGNDENTNPDATSYAHPGGIRIMDIYAP